MITLEIIQSEVASFYRRDLDLMFSPNRKHDVIKMRHLFYYLVRLLKPTMSFSEIGSYKLKRDHSAVLSAVKNMENWIETDKDFRIQANIILANCRRNCRGYEPQNFIQAKYHLISRLVETNTPAELYQVVGEHLHQKNNANENRTAN